MKIDIKTLRKTKGIGGKTLERIIEQHKIDKSIKSFKSEYIPSDIYKIDKDINLWQGDCLEIMSHIPDNSVDMVLCDLPYGTTTCSWDEVIPFEPLWSHYKRIIKDIGAIVLFGSEPFSTKLRMSNIDWYKYDWIWVKNNITRFMSVDKYPLKQHEMIHVFTAEDKYFQKMSGIFKMYREEKKLSKQYMDNVLGSNTLYSFFEGRTLRGKTVYSRPNNEHMSILIDELNIKKDHIDILNQKSVFNQITLHDTHIKHNPRDKHREDNHYSFNSDSYIQTKSNYHRDVVYFNRPQNNLHPTQKPVDLLEYLIKTYTNEDMLVLDNTMGSGSTGVACKNTNRRFIGIELDEKYFNIAKDRIENIE